MGPGTYLKAVTGPLNFEECGMCQGPGASLEMNNATRNTGL